MTWSLVGTVDLTTEWQYSQPVTGSLFRLNFSAVPLPYGFRGLVALALDVETKPSLYRVQKFYGKTESDIISLPVSNTPSPCYLALKRRDRYFNPWQVEIEQFLEPQISAWEPLPIGVGQTVFTLTSTALDPATAIVYLNGLKATLASDYRIDGVLLTWLSAIPLEPSDRLEIYY